MRLNSVTNCGELKVRHLSLKKPLLYLDVSNTINFVFGVFDAVNF